LEQEETISCRLIPLLTHVSFRCTVPLIFNFIYYFLSGKFDISSSCLGKVSNKF
jgi:hypothetical protein